MLDCLIMLVFFDAKILQQLNEKVTALDVDLDIHRFVEKHSSGRVWSPELEQAAVNVTRRGSSGGSSRRQPRHHSHMFPRSILRRTIARAPSLACTICQANGEQD